MYVWYYHNALLLLIGIRILQGILLKVCLLLGVKIHGGVIFTGLLEPKNANSGWMATVNPSSCPVSSYHFDVIMAVDGKQNSLPGFRLKEFRAKLALAITVNFVNSNTKQESSVPEISGVAYVYRQDFFKSLASTHGIELENIVYYKDETHYFVMTATKNSLLKKGVLKKVSMFTPTYLLSHNAIYSIMCTMCVMSTLIDSETNYNSHRITVTQSSC